MASITLTIIGCIGYLVDIGAIFTHDVFPFVAAGANNEFLIPAKKSPRCLLGGDDGFKVHT